MSVSDGGPIERRALDAIRALQRPGKPDLLGRVVGLFESEAPASVASLQEALASADLTTVRDTAHALKSSSAYVGAMTLSGRCRELEQAAREGNLPGCVALADALEDDLDAALAALRELFDRAA